MPRLFVAVGLGPQVRLGLVEYLERCREIDSGARWVPAANLHLTLAFLGRLEAADRVRAALGHVRAQPFEARLGGAGRFRTRSGSVVWLSVDAGLEPLTQLAGCVATAVRGADRTALDSQPERRFHPHLTLGRAKGSSALPVLPVPPALPAWRIETFELYESVPGVGAPVYRVVESYGLKT